jgi:hypothetical protein
MNQLITVVISVLAGALVVTMTAPPPVAIITICAVVFTAFLGYRIIKGR